MLSVIICTHNPRPAYFARCLAALEVQTFPRAQWELILVDNSGAFDQEFNDMSPRLGATGGALTPISGCLARFGFRFVATYLDHMELLIT